MKEKVIAITGPTASGKTKIAIELAKKLGTEIISGDSMLVYRGLDIGTAKPTLAEMEGIPHHLIDIIEPTENFTVVDFLRLAKSEITRLNQAGKIPIIAGGTGFYLKSLLEGYLFPAEDGKERQELEAVYQQKGLAGLVELLSDDAKASLNKSDRQNPHRLLRAIEKERAGYIPSKAANFPYHFLAIGLSWERATLYDRINLRIDQMLASGFIDEVKGLLEQYPKELRPLNAIGYKEIIAYLDGNLSYDEMREEAKKSTRHFAKRQFTWYKKMPYIKWLEMEGKSVENVVEIILADEFFS